MRLNIGLVGGGALGIVLGMGATAFAQDRDSAQTNDTGTAAEVKLDEERIEKRIESRLNNDRRLKDDDIDVEIEDGVVTLTGKVDGTTEKMRAARLARVKGVARVENRIEVGARARGERDRDVGDAARDAGEAIGDGWITTKVKTQFVGVDPLDDSEIDVDTTNNVVTLKGTVRSEAGRARAVDIARATKGVKRVVDHLTIGPARK